jgi:hypothetical protein
MAMTAEALTAFGVTYGLETALETALRVLAWLDRARPEWSQKPTIALPTILYRGNAALLLEDETLVERAVESAVELLDRSEPGPLVLALALSFLARASPRHARAARRCEPLRKDLAERFARATKGKAPVSLAEWAELAVAFPVGSKTSRDVLDWLKGQQFPSGAFPDTTASDFVYSRGTGKIFEVLALYAAESSNALDRALGWLLSMQYRADSVFFVPSEHRDKVLGGLRHDFYVTDAWIDAAGHFLLGLARLAA